MSNKLFFKYAVYSVKNEHRSRYTEYGTEDTFWYTHMEECVVRNMEHQAVQWIEEYGVPGEEYVILKVYNKI